MNSFLLLKPIWVGKLHNYIEWGLFSSSFMPSSSSSSLFKVKLKINFYNFLPRIDRNILSLVSHNDTRALGRQNPIICTRKATHILTDGVRDQLGLVTQKLRKRRLFRHISASLMNCPTSEIADREMCRQSARWGFEWWRRRKSRSVNLSMKWELEMGTATTMVI